MKTNFKRLSYMSGYDAKVLISKIIENLYEEHPTGPEMCGERIRLVEMLRDNDLIEDKK